ncbi:hypothetical protein FRC10_008019 [Ceratobasidium sp. 414]|nr:hypothetical protein FRC10_008019 [Ceratobasidium sp. 414]
MGTSATHDFTSPDFASFFPTDLSFKQLLEFLPHISQCHLPLLGENPLPAYPGYGLGAPVPTALAAPPTIGATNSPPSPDTPLIPASPTNPPFTRLPSPEIPGGNTAPGHNQMTTGATSDKTALEHASTDADGRSMAGSSMAGLPDSANSHNLPRYGSGLVHRSKRRAHTPAKSSSGTEHQGSVLLRVVDGDSSSSDGEGESKFDTHAQSIDPLRREEIRQQRVASEQRRRNDLRGGFAHLKDTLPNSHRKCSKTALLDQATQHLLHLEAMLQQRQDALAACQMEVTRLQDRLARRRHRSLQSLT